jgi:hypothetical protein
VELDRLHFGRKARRKAKLKRIIGWLALASTAAFLVNFPGSGAGLDFIRSLEDSALVVRSGPGTGPSGAGAGTIRLRRLRPRNRPSARFDSAPTSSARSDPAPTPSPSPSPAPAEPPSTTQIIYNAAAEFGLSGDYLVGVAICESDLDPSAYNPAGYHGLFQFDFETWGAHGYGDIYDPVAQARTAAELLAAGHYSRWPNCA